MIKNASSGDVKRALDFSVSSSFAKATRRIIYNLSYDDIAERGYFHVDVMSGVGSGLLVYQDFRFFLLTAKHNLLQLYSPEYRNESPLWVPRDHPPNWSDTNDFFMARRIWYVGELIQFECEIIDPQDVVLIEFFFPLKAPIPKQFINVGNSNYFLKEDQFFENQILICSGFPMKSNEYIELKTHSEYTQSAMIHLEHKIGVLLEEGREKIVRFPPPVKATHADLNGFSGGPVYSAFYNESEIKLAGIIQLAGGQLRFLPAFVFHEALRSYKNARCEVLDEASRLVDDTERPDEMLRFYCDKESADVNFRKKLDLY